MNFAMVLCAGFGTRMQEYTATCPKPMLQVCGRPILEHTIRHLKSLGITDVVINLHYLHDQIISYFTDGGKWGVNIHYSYEETPLGTAGALKKAEPFFKEAKNIIVLYGDVVCNENYVKLIELCIEKNAQAVIVLHERVQSNSVVEMDKDQKITRFLERPTYEVKDKKQNWINSGLYCFSRSIFSKIPDDCPADFPRDIFPGLVQSGLLYGYPLKAYRCAIDAPERYKKVQSDFLISEGEYPAFCP